MSAHQKPTIGNPCAKQVDALHAYEVWQSFDGSWTYYVLRKYSAKESTFSRWYCAVSSPATMGKLEYGDVYSGEVKTDTVQLELNPLTGRKVGDNGSQDQAG